MNLFLLYVCYCTLTASQCQWLLLQQVMRRYITTKIPFNPLIQFKGYFIKRQKTTT